MVLDMGAGKVQHIKVSMRIEPLNEEEINRMRVFLLEYRSAGEEI